MPEVSNDNLWYRGVQQAFARAAPTYAQAATVQKVVRQELLERLAGIRLSVRRFVDIGTATGEVLPALAARFPEAEGIGIDIALPMVHRIPKVPFWQKRRYWGVVAEMHVLPLSHQSVQLVFSNLTLQWSPDPQKALLEWQRVLAPEGLLLLSTLGTETFYEIRTAWADIAPVRPLMGLQPLERLGDTLLALGFQHPVVDVERMTLTYPTLADVLRALKNTGTFYAPGRGLRTPRQWQRIEQAYPKTAEGAFPVTYEVLYALAWQPAQPQIRRGSAVYVSFPRKDK